ncbi:DinB family protein [Marinilongibacter aquaticus]|uniref:DinB family protein n=1 Tax=Marinilongibacter aquaticus TaxID=2975157 RepID=UPI0021BD4289|nr:DinB family protein [Marinilongibacter aquaticus]UBM57317.1 DinB family protein [Marinilongibacter aquaticus]
MKPMKDVAHSLREIVQTLYPELKKLEEPAVSEKDSPSKWSKKEILGHLIDSATNNQKKFVMAASIPNLDIVPYAQDEWVALQAYQKTDWENLVSLWYFMNLHLAHVIEQAEASVLGNTFTIGGAGPFALSFVMKDYEQHLRHHMRVILPHLNLHSEFKMVY